MTTVTAVVVAYGRQPWLESCVEAVLASVDVTADVVVVDNGGLSGAVGQGVAERPRVRVLRPGRNTGFAEGCNLGAVTATGEVLALVNPDVLVDADALAKLAAAALKPEVGIATASLRLAGHRDLINSAGNPVHYTGFAWAGGHDEPAARHAAPKAVASASGACCALRRSVWIDMGGFEPAYFAYHEDVELSLRCWQRGYDVIYVADAIAVHHYEFSRNAAKYELLERNRWVTVLTIYSARTLILLMPVLLGTELLVLIVAGTRGWLAAKLAGYRWLWRHRRLIGARRRAVQGGRLRSDRELAAVFSARFTPTNLGRLPGLPVINAAYAAYWAVVRRLL
jgi:GT2 family glycosyltransferase